MALHPVSSPILRLYAWSCNNIIVVKGLFLTEMGAPGTTNILGDSSMRDFSKIKFQVPCTQPPPEDGSEPVRAGSRTDMGALVLFLVSNWFVNGETVLIDGGVRDASLSAFLLSLTFLLLDSPPSSIFLLNLLCCPSGI